MRLPPDYLRYPSLLFSCVIIVVGYLTPLYIQVFLHCATLHKEHEATKIRVLELSRTLELERQSHRLELEGLRGEFTCAVPTYKRSEVFKSDAIAYARGHLRALAEELLASEWGQNDY